MIGNPIRKNEVFKKTLNSWRRIYCIVLPIFSVVAYFICYKIWEIKIWESKNFPDTLTSMVTFVSIIISFFGVLLTILISAKEKSELINYFLDTADKEVFASSIKRLILHGLLTVIISAILFMYDIMSECEIVIYVCIGIFTLVRFTTLTYRFTNILLMLFLKDRKVYAKIEDEKLSEEAVKELDERLQKGI
jgi:hypothetical protein|nr:MAG TPA: hypothetical protein [Caudoviricetes sp.]